MSELKIFRLKGYYNKKRKKIPINMDVRALKVDQALEKMYSVIGSRHLVKRRDIFIEKDSGITVIENKGESLTKEFVDIDEEGFYIPQQ